jgi:hypothetical protein
MISYGLLGNLVNWTKKDTDMNLDSTILVVKESAFLSYSFHMNLSIRKVAYYGYPTFFLCRKLFLFVLTKEFYHPFSLTYILINVITIQ